MSSMKPGKARIPSGLRRTLAAVATSAVVIAGWQLHSTAPSGLGAIGLPGATADPTGPPGPAGGPTGGMNGSQFQPPSLPNSMPDYQGGINQPPLDQNNGISIYNTGSQTAPEQGPHEAGQQAGQGQQPQHGNQIPSYQTAAPYTQGPGKANPDYQEPQQGNQAQQPQQGQQPQEHSPSQAPTQTQQPQNRQDDSTRQLRDQQQQERSDEMQRCISSVTMSAVGGVGGFAGGRSTPGQDPIFQADGSCSDCDTEKPRQYNRNCEDYKYLVPADKPLNSPCGYTYDPDSKVTPEDKKARHDFCSVSMDKPGYGNFDFSFACARHDMCYDIADSKGDGYGGCNDKLYTDIKKVCEPIGGWEGFRCNRLAEVYWAAVTGSHLFHL
ncbi:phospholipase A2 [Mycobacteroides chelonae]|uniref:phospholipase A2 n=1 Tax=Mycobacteroides chelonae TaxID=1774 RepID=UPI000A42917D|nr:phospholipase A2 [Mycobacteroides chelonae]